MAKGCCGADVATNTIVVRTIGGNPMLPAAAIDAPANGEAFCAAVMKAAEAAVSLLTLTLTRYLQTHEAAAPGYKE